MFLMIEIYSRKFSYETCTDRLAVCSRLSPLAVAFIIQVLESTAMLMYRIAVLCDSVRPTGGETSTEGQCQGLLEGAIYI